MRTFSHMIAGALVTCAFAFPAIAQTITVVAAENFYGDVARQIGRAHVDVTSILSSPDQDPHLFEASPSTARKLATARIVISNGADYDPWMEKLLAANKSPRRQEIVVASLINKKAGDNPHVWYDPGAMKALTGRLEAMLIAADAAHRAEFNRGAVDFINALKPLDAKVAEIKQRYAGTSITASEPVFGYMAQALDLKMRNERFQMAVQNNTEPSISDIAAFETDLKQRRVRLMVFNNQAGGPTVERLVAMAKEQKIPVVGITETMPEGKNYQDWMLGQLDAVQKALAGSAQ
jgi:zinc/manganese transport system substrate-binding protein